MKGHIRPRGPRRWQIVYDLPPGPDGKRRQQYETLEGPKKDAQVRLREILLDIDRGIYAQPGKITLARLLDDHLENLKQSVRGSTWRQYEVYARRHLKPVLGHIEARKLTPLQIEGCYRELRARLSDASLLNVHNFLSGALERGAKHRILSMNPCQTITPPRPVRQEAQALDAQQCGELLRSLEGTRYHAPVLVALATGVRIGELLGLLWSDLDLDQGVLTVRRTAQRTAAGVVLLDHPKTKSSRRTITLPSVAVECLKRHRVDQLNEKMRLRLVWREPAGELVFPNELGGPWAPDNLSKAFKVRVLKLGLPDRISFHSLRHSHATALLMANIPARIAAGRLGHSSTRVTTDTYQHLFADAQDEAARRIDEAMRGAIG